MSLYQPTIADLFHTHIIPAAYQICVTFAEVVIPFVDRKSHDYIERLKVTESKYRLEYYSEIYDRTSLLSSTINWTEVNPELDDLIDVGNESIFKLSIFDMIMGDKNLDTSSKLLMIYNLTRDTYNLWRYDNLRCLVSAMKEQGTLSVIHSKTPCFMHILYLSIPIFFESEWLSLITDIITAMEDIDEGVNELLDFICDRVPDVIWNHRSLLVMVAYSIDPNKTVDRLKIDDSKFNRSIRPKYVKVSPEIKEMRKYESIINMEIAKER